MIIDLSKSKLFTVDPDVRFAREYQLPQGIWKDLYRRHLFLEYKQNELCEFLAMKTGRKPSLKSINRWIVRTKIYSISSPVVKKGAIHVHSHIFGEYEMDVIKEITKNLRSSATESSKSII